MTHGSEAPFTDIAVECKRIAAFAADLGLLRAAPNEELLSAGAVLTRAFYCTRYARSNTDVDEVVLSRARQVLMAEVRRRACSDAPTPADRVKSDGPAELLVDLVNAVATAIARADGVGEGVDLFPFVRRAREMHDSFLEAMILHEPAVSDYTRAVARSTDAAIDHLEQFVLRTDRADYPPVNGPSMNGGEGTIGRAHSKWSC